MQDGFPQFFDQPVVKIVRARLLRLAEKFRVHFRRYAQGNMPGKGLFRIRLGFEVKVNGPLEVFKSGCIACARKRFDGPNTGDPAVPASVSRGNRDQRRTQVQNFWTRGGKDSDTGQ